MKRVDQALENLLIALENEPVVIAFKKARELVTNDAFILATETKLKDLQQEITRHAMDKTRHENALNTYTLLKKKYDGHPYVLNYNSLLNDVNDLLLTIKSIIQ